MKRHLTALLAFLFVFGFTIVIYKLLEGSLDETTNSIVSKLIRLILAILLMIYFNKEVRLSYRINNISKFDFLLIVLVLVLFGINNLVFIKLGESFEYNTLWGLTFLILTIGSIGEEFLYRGFIQTYINKEDRKQKAIISNGNIFATILMTLTHLGFYMILTPLFATTSLLLVIIFSLTAGHLRDKTNGIIVPIVFHLMANYLHLLIQTSF